LRASDLEAVEMRPEVLTRRDGHVYIQIENLQDNNLSEALLYPIQVENPQDDDPLDPPPRPVLIESPQVYDPFKALPHHMQVVPRALWRSFIGLNLSFNDQLRLRGTCVYFQRLVESVPNFKAMMAENLAAVELSLGARPLDTCPLDSVRSFACVFRALDRFSIADGPPPSDDHRQLFEDLRGLRQLPDLDQDVIFRGCERYGVQPRSILSLDLPMRQTSFHFRYNNIKMIATLLVPTSVALMAVWAIFVPGAWPSITTSKIPTVDLRVPSVRWDQLFWSFPYRLYFINGDLSIFRDWNRGVTPELLAQIDHTTILHLTLENMSSVAYSCLPYTLFIGIPYVALLTFYPIWTGSLNHIGDVRNVSWGTIKSYHNRARGVLSESPGVNSLWFGTKIIASAVLVTVMALSISSYHDFAEYWYGEYNWRFDQAINALQRTYNGDYAGYAHYLVGSELPGSPFSPWALKQCATTLAFDVFNNNTGLFMANQLMDRNGTAWQIHNGVLIHNYLYAGCSKIFDVLINNSLVGALTPVNILYSFPSSAALVRTSAFILTYEGYWLAPLLPQFIMVLHMLYFLFIAVW